MDTIREMLRTHPQKPTTHFDEIAACLSACAECEQVCISCADACLGEESVPTLRQCIRLNLDCADLCAAAARMIARQASPEPRVWRLTLEACAEACRACAVECARHASAHAHCRVCRERCESCEKACRTLIAALPTGGAKAEGARH